MANIKQNQQPLDENGKEHGEWIEYYNNGQLFYRCTFVHGINHGLQEGYFKDGRLSHRGYRNLGREIGYWFYDKRKKYYLCLI